MPVEKYPHILLRDRRRTRSYTPPGRRIDVPPDTPLFDQRSHGADLNQAYQQALGALEAQYEMFGLDPATVDKGAAVEFKFRPGTKVDVTSLEDARGQKIEVLNVRLDEQGNPESAILYIPPRKKEKIQKQIGEYADPDKNGKYGPRNYKKYDKTTTIAAAALDRFWIDAADLPESVDQPYTWEVWLREGQFERFRARAAELGGITVSEHHLTFPERQICSVHCSLAALNKLELITKAITGFRFLWTSGGFFEGMEPREQREWSEELISRLTFHPDAHTSVCILDTGIAANHPLLAGGIAENGIDSCNPDEWGTYDHHGHGTEMAGLALLGDLTLVLEHAEPVEVAHLLESVKVFPPDGENDIEHIGYITAQAVFRAEINRPDLSRVFCLSWTVEHEARTKNYAVTRGRPTPLSARVDQLAFGVDEGGDWRINDDKKRLLIVSAGNIRDAFSPDEYPDINDLSEVEDPAQAWNALSVGACTNKTFTNDPSYDGWSPVAGTGQISPKSRTSVLWSENYWPTKPDIVVEGGNCLTNGRYMEAHPDTCPLTTNKNGIFCHTQDTSAANAEAARLAATLAAQYPEFWPETIRGMLVHSAEWTPSMLEGQSLKYKQGRINLIRRNGYGVPNREFLINSYANRPCVVIQDYLQPFAQSETGTNIVFKDMNHYALPWPREQLADIIDGKVKLRVTLSYFIEPSPSERPPRTKYSYASHELRFKLNRPNESEDAFLARISQELAINEINEEESGEYAIKHARVTEQDRWVLGQQSRDRGSLISDIWEGTGPELAEQNLIAVVPQMGWWKYRRSFPTTEKGRFNQRVRYALILSLICETEVDLYTPITQQIAVATEIAV